LNTLQTAYNATFKTSDKIKFTRFYSLKKVLNIWPNTTWQILYNSLLLYTATCFDCPDQPSSARCRTYKKNIKGKRSVFTAV